MRRIALLLLACLGTARAGSMPVVTSQRPLPINLATALSLANASPLDIAVAQRRTQAAAAELDRANALWLPSVVVGADYFRHDGQIQDIVGTVFSTSRSAFMAGVGPTAVFALSDAYYAPIAARQVVQARRHEEQATRNDTTLAVALAYFEVQRARGEVAGSVEALARARDLVSRCEKLSPGLIPALEVSRARNELHRRRLAIEAAHERWQTQSAELARLLRLDAAALVVPVEPPQLPVYLFDTSGPPDALIEAALTQRPELAAYQALVQAALARLRHERIRPLVPSLALRGVATNPPNGMAFGVFGGGVNSQMRNFDLRNSIDVQATWELRNLGLGNRAAVRRREAENEEAVLRLARLQDQVAAEVVQAHVRAARAQARLAVASQALRDAQETAEKSLEGMGQTRRAGGLLLLVVRPQEAVAAVAALDQGYRDYFSAVADFNRAQFQLHRAVGQPAQGLHQQVPEVPINQAPR